MAEELLVIRKVDSNGLFKRVLVELQAEVLAAELAVEFLVVGGAVHEAGVGLVDDEQLFEVVDLRGHLVKLTLLQTYEY